MTNLNAFNLHELFSEACAYVGEIVGQDMYVQEVKLEQKAREPTTLAVEFILLPKEED